MTKYLGLAIAAAMAVPAYLSVANAAPVYNTSLAEPAGFYNGSGSSNSEFTVNTVNGVEFGLSAVLRSIGPITPVGNVYSVAAGAALGNPLLARWNFQYSINLQAGPGNAGLVLDDIIPTVRVSNVGNGTTVSYNPFVTAADNAGWNGTTETLIAGPTDVGFQNSQNLMFGQFGPLFFDMNVDNTYLISLFASGPGEEFLGQTDIVVVVGAGAETPLPAALPLFATGLGILGFVARRRKQKAVSI